MRRATSTRQVKQTCRVISIHALLAESDERANRLADAPPEISIHALLAESDRPTLFDTAPHISFYPRSPCGERHTWARGSRVTYVISIHALLAESDALSQSSAKSTPISIHALLAESDTAPPYNLMIHCAFLSTLSLRRATSL